MDEVLAVHNIHQQYCVAKGKDIARTEKLFLCDDHVLLYAKIWTTEIWTNSRNLHHANKTGYANPDNDPRGRWRSIPISAQVS